MTLGETVDEIEGPVKPILDLWEELRAISGQENFPAIQAEHVRAIAKALHTARQEGAGRNTRTEQS